MIVAVWGLEKSCKTTFSLTFPEPIRHFDFDYGLERAIHRFKDKEIISTPYPTPLQREIRLKGVKELWYGFTSEYHKAAEGERMATLVVDTATQAWEVCRLAYLQEKQEHQEPGDKPRQSLLPIEYGEPNSRMKSIIQIARQCRKNLVLTHYAKDEYVSRVNRDTGRVEEVRSGKLLLDGFKWTEGLVDLVVYTSTATIVNKEDKTELLTPQAIITLSGLDLRMTGMQLSEPSYDNILTMLKMLRGEE